MKWVRANRHLLAAWAWILLIPPTLFWWKDSILWVALMSLYANIETAFGAHEAHKSRKQQEST